MLSANSGPDSAQNETPLLRQKILELQKDKDRLRGMYGIGMGAGSSQDQLALQQHNRSGKATNRLSTWFGDTTHDDHIDGDSDDGGDPTLDIMKQFQRSMSGMKNPMQHCDASYDGAEPHDSYSWSKQWSGQFRHGRRS